MKREHLWQRLHVYCWPGVKCGASNDIWRNVKSPRHNLRNDFEAADLLSRTKKSFSYENWKRDAGEGWFIVNDLNCGALQRLSVWWWYLGESCHEWRNARVWASLNTARAGLYGQQEARGERNLALSLDIKLISHHTHTHTQLPTDTPRR